MVERPAFVCDACGNRVTPGSYRAHCPECGGTLQQDVRAVPGADR